MFGTWLAYILLVVLWEKVLRVPLHEWKYVLLNCLAASFFIMNHYFFFAPFYMWVINGCTLIYAGIWYWLGMRQESKTLLWKCAGLILVLVYSALYVGFEMLGRLAVAQGLHEVWIMAASYVGLVSVILWRRA
jgi:hypothetical protein